jgi:hypothetical protein
LHVFWNQSDQTNNGQTVNSDDLGEKQFEIARKTQLAKHLISLIAKQYNINKKQYAQNTA